ncbi:MAG: hypothetical protein ACPGJV_15275 [Bacteriovoracaceae bacterium]
MKIIIVTALMYSISLLASVPYDELKYSYGSLLASDVSRNRLSQDIDSVSSNDALLRNTLKSNMCFDGNFVNAIPID